MDVNGFFSALLTGIVIGLLARIVTPGMNNIGCILTVLIGIVGAVAGLAVGAWLDTGFWLTFGIQILIAAVLVALFGALSRVRQ